MKFNNIISNYLPREYDTLSSSVEANIDENIEMTKNNQDIINAQAGVYYGEYAWD